MRHSLETAAQVTTVIEVDMTGVVNLRKKWKPEYQSRYGVNLTYVPFIMRATDRRDRPLAVGERRGAGRRGAHQAATSTWAWPSPSTTPRA